MVMEDNTATTNPFPGPAIVTCVPPKIETIKPPTTAEIIPAMGGAPEANASPKPIGRAIRETTKPAKILAGSCFTNVLVVVLFKGN